MHIADGTFFRLYKALKALKKPSINSSVMAAYTPKGIDELADLGWDVTDGRGRQLLCAPLFYRVLVAVEKGLCGHEAGEAPSDEELEDEAEAWGASLLRGA